MAEVVETIEIARGQQEVWAVLADFAAIATWAPNVDHSCVTTAQVEGVGAVRRVQVGRNAVLERIVEWTPGEALSYEIEGLPAVIRSATNRWSLSGSGGTTTATLTSVVDAGPRPPQKVVARAAGRTLAKGTRQLLSGLKKRVEEAP